jgi:hypothetical protein
MAREEEIVSNWLKSKEVEKELKISSCDLMHIREKGKLTFKKAGNAYLYLRKDVVILKTNL